MLNFAKLLSFYANDCAVYIGVVGDDVLVVVYRGVEFCLCVKMYLFIVCKNASGRKCFSDCCSILFCSFGGRVGYCVWWLC